MIYPSLLRLLLLLLLKLLLLALQLLLLLLLLLRTSWEATKHVDTRALHLVHYRRSVTARYC